MEKNIKETVCEKDWHFKNMNSLKRLFSQTIEFNKLTFPIHFISTLYRPRDSPERSDPFYELADVEQVRSLPSKTYPSASKMDPLLSFIGYPGFFPSVKLELRSGNAVFYQKVLLKCQKMDCF
ncbi:hypothetical protein CEXT_563711 [Caerostris extrusa]|uniref:Uncharacterized protein n=1 Tax=Caerostris extrusa TaxID=172846 RepID=A0AAV4TCG8_CAEEX|nr:hypothetical protein CEXT_563711 [Caerostris extrusa]